MDAGGTRAIAKNRSAPHRKTTITIPRGTSVQAISRAVEPWMGRGRSSRERRRKRMAKLTTSVAMRTPKNTLTRMRKR